ncbi:HNH endonuclease [Geothrix rubra]|uniref:HNH endonuclease n=1 Tax=Geothrix rubra TaxID=2927977 RepID=UPI0025530086|nr:HNH endonuclease [Geothrix rubra]
MADNIISYIEMCQREGASLQRGMNFGLGGNHSVILMSIRPNAPYQDRIEEDGTVLIYEGHDQPRKVGITDPKSLDQLGNLPSGRPTENGKFRQAALAYKNGSRQAERVRVYEKIKDGIWSYNGVFHLVDAWVQSDGKREVFRFRLIAIEGDEDFSIPALTNFDRRRIIPSSVKLQVWQRDKGRCTECGATDELHFDHILPFSKGGTSLTAENVQLLCARHNLAKSSKIQ